MSVYQLKSAFQNQLRPISDRLVKYGFTANQVTLSAVILSLIIAHLISHQARHQKKYWYLLPAGLFVRMAMNAIDGMMAKEHGQESTLGAYLNEAGDVVSDTALFMSLSPHTSHQAYLILTIALSLTTELTAILAALLTGERANHGPMGKSDRALVLGVLGSLMAMNKRPKSERLLFILMELLLIKTIVNRGRYIITHKDNSHLSQNPIYPPSSI